MNTPETAPAKCQTCGQNAAEEEHPRPFREDVNNDSESLCNCCAKMPTRMRDGHMNEHQQFQSDLRTYGEATALDMAALRQRIRDRSLRDRQTEFGRGQAMVKRTSPENLVVSNSSGAACPTENLPPPVKAEQLTTTHSRDSGRVNLKDVNQHLK